jgi:regulator of protease activity HflC (stomatin/prohibitin superfamily)
MRGFSFTVGSIIVLAILVGLVLIGFPTYNVYSKQMKGRAAYEEAVQNRRIRVLEAQAALDAAKLTAQAEIERAKGTNEANRIMSVSLGGPDNYLRWSYIHMLEETAGQGDRQIIYLPTEAGMPILEAGRRPTGTQAGR